MLRNTFCHFPGIGVVKEQELWTSGIHSWDALLETDSARCRSKDNTVSDHIKRSIEHLEGGNPRYFADRLLHSQHWRFFPEFRRSIAYLDIETTGLGYGHSITTIAVYDGESVYTYVQGDNLGKFKEDINRYKLIVTYNGKSFDVPFIERFFKIKMEQPNVDLMYVLRSLGYVGGLKKCERRLGIDRKELADVDGYTAVLLWNEYRNHNNDTALETLLAYNVEDVLNLETLLVTAYNKKIAGTPFCNSHKVEAPADRANPHKVDEKILTKVSDRRW